MTEVDETSALRTWARQLFGTADDVDEPDDEQERRRNVVPQEGDNPGATISDEARMRDLAARLFGDADATETRLPEE
jgi:hypothetical protein